MNAARTISELGVVHFDIVGSCQLRCVGCPNSTILDKVTRIDPVFFGICLANIDVQYVSTFRLFNFGEPLLHNKLPSIFDELASKPKFSIGHLEMSTNAQFVRWDQLEDVLSRRMLSRLVVSCDGDGTPSSYERMRPPAKWETLLEFLTKAKEIRDRVSPDLDLMTRNVLLDDNHAGRWKEILLPLGWRPEFRRWINLVGGAESLAGREWTPGRGVCMYVSEWPQLFVDADGTVVPCCAHPRAGNFGNLSTMKWSEIHFGKPREEFVLQMTNERSSMRTCNVCEFGADTDNSKYLVPETADA